MHWSTLWRYCVISKRNLSWPAVVLPFIVENQRWKTNHCSWFEGIAVEGVTEGWGFSICLLILNSVYTADLLNGIWFREHTSNALVQKSTYVVLTQRVQISKNEPAYCLPVVEWSTTMQVLNLGVWYTVSYKVMTMRSNIKYFAKTERHPL